MENHHLQQSISSGKELPHDDLQKLLALEILLISGKLDLKLLKENRDLVLLLVHDGVEDLEDGVKNELIESTLERLSLMSTVLCPLLGLGVEVAIALRYGQSQIHALYQSEYTHP
jgi:hypothetical protein